MAGIEQISGVFLSLSLPKQDLYSSKQYHFGPHMLLQSTQIESSLETVKFVVIWQFDSRLGSDDFGVCVI